MCVVFRVSWEGCLRVDSRLCSGKVTLRQRRQYFNISFVTNTEKSTSFNTSENSHLRRALEKLPLQRINAIIG